MAIGHDEITSINSSLEKDDDDLETFIMILLESLKEVYAKNKDLKIKINALLNENSKLFHENKRLRKKNEVNSILKMDNLKIKLDEKTKFYEKIKEEKIC